MQIGDGLFRALVENVSDLVAVVDGDGRLRWLSPSVRAMLGHEPEDVVGRPVADLVVGDRADLDASLAAVLASPGAHGPFALRLADRSGSTHVVEVVATNRLDDPSVAGIVVVGRDETERERDREQLRRREAWSQALVRQGFDLILVIDPKGMISYVSPSVREVLDLTPDELVGTTAFDLVHPDDVDDVLTDLADLLADPGRHRVTNLRARRRDGTWRHLAVYGSDLTDEPAVGGIVINAHDVTEQVEATAALARSEQRFRALVQHSTDIVVLMDPDGTVQYFSPAVERVLGFSAETSTGGNVFGLVHPEDVDLARQALTQALGRPGVSEPVELRVQATDGTWRHLEILPNNLLDDPDVAGVVFNGRDVTDRRNAEDLLSEQAALLESAALGAPLGTTLERITLMIEARIPGAEASVGVLGRDGVIRHPFAPSLEPAIVAALDESSPDSPVGQVVRSGASRACFPDLGRDERWRGLWEPFAEAGLQAAWVYPVYAPGTTDLVGLLAVFHPDARPPSEEEEGLCARALHLAAIVLERHRFEDQLRHQALHDALTGLPNRTLLLDRIEQGLARARRHGRDVAVLFVDLDLFKVINDSLGHAAGDKLLDQVASRFRTSIRTGDTVGRFGGDEFVVLCEEVGGENGAIDVAQRLAVALERPFEVDGSELVMTASIGIAMATDVDPDTGAEALIRNADAAMYRAKDLGRAGYAVFEESLHRRVLHRLELDRALRAALPAGELELWFQPQVRLADQVVVGLEGLLRWNRDGHVQVPPSEFVPIAEETGFILPLGAWVLEEAGRQLAEWRDHPVLGGLRVTVNVSARQLADPGLHDLVAGVLDRHRLAPHLLGLEVTESALVGDVETAVDALNKLHELGVRLSIDDFGTGYATLDYVRRFSMADELKIDGAFVADLEGGAVQDRAIVSASVVIAHSFGLTPVAEGVETVQQREVLVELGCEHAQGFLFTPAVPAADLVAALEAQGLRTDGGERAR